MSNVLPVYPEFYELGTPPQMSVAPSKLRTVNPYEDKPKGSQACGLLLGIIVVILILWLIGRTTSCSPHRVVPVFVNGMRAKLSSADDAHLKPEVSKKVCKPGSKDPKCLQNLTPCQAGDKNCHPADGNKVNPSVHKEHDESVKKFLKETPVSMIMIYAPWCPHCHTAMPKFAEASEKSGGVPYALINAEMVSPQLLHGENALFNVQYFPYILRREKKGTEFSDTLFKNAPTTENLVAHSKTDSLQFMFS